MITIIHNDVVAKLDSVFIDYLSDTKMVVHTQDKNSLNYLQNLYDENKKITIHNTPSHDYRIQSITAINSPIYGQYYSIVLKQYVESNVTLTIQIGNTDDKLTHSEWYRFISNSHSLIQLLMEEIHFYGSSSFDVPWQNVCWVLDIKSTNIDSLKEGLANIAHDFNQDSIAMTIGTTEFIKPKKHSLLTQSQFSVKIKP